MYLKRKIDKDLVEWAAMANRKPLLLRGARQVGKSWAVRNLAKKFEHFVEINFDDNPKFNAVFEQGLSPSEICEQLSVVTNTPIIPGKPFVIQLFFVHGTLLWNCPSTGGNQTQSLGLLLGCDIVLIFRVT
jgi:uncharacterized protein (DUF736 family)